jgi:hypothetical protein
MYIPLSEQGLHDALGHDPVHPWGSRRALGPISATFRDLV